MDNHTLTLSKIVRFFKFSVTGRTGAMDVREYRERGFQSERTSASRRLSVEKAIRSRDQFADEERRRPPCLQLYDTRISHEETRDRLFRASNHGR